MIIVDVDRRMTIAYMMNKMAAGIIGGPRSDALIRAAYAALGSSMVAGAHGWSVARLRRNAVSAMAWTRLSWRARNDER